MTSSGESGRIACGGNSEAETRGLSTGIREGFRLGKAGFQAEGMACLKARRLQGALFFGEDWGTPV